VLYNKVVGNVPKNIYAAWRQSQLVSVTIIDVAKASGVSKSTASRVLSNTAYGVSEKAKRDVLEAARALGYIKNTLATGLRTTHTHTVLLIIPDITNSFWAEVARGAQDVFDQKGYSLFLANSDWQADREKRYLEVAIANKVDAVLLNAPDIGQIQLDSLPFPIVELGDKLVDVAHPVVGTDTRKAISEAMEYLWSMGHRRIGMILPSGPEIEGVTSIRYKAYEEFFRSKGQDVDKSLICKTPLTLESGRLQAHRIAALPDRPSALLTGNDLVAVGFLQACSQLHLKVPEDISLMGMDDIPAASMVSPRLTTVAKPQREIGKTAAHIAIDLIEGMTSPAKTLLEANIIERETVRRVL
jgi:DNA-binding LacI/PurR family transcriptional regulator